MSGFIFFIKDIIILIIFGVFSPPTARLYLCTKKDMATSIITDLDYIYLSSHLPEEVSFETDAASLKIDIYVNNKKVFTSDYYPYSMEVTIRDIRSIVEAAMISERLSLSTLKIVATEPVEQKSNTTYDENGNIYVNFDEQPAEPVTETVDGIKVVFCQFRTSRGSDTFLNQSFLTTRSSVLLPRSGQMKLCHFSKANAHPKNDVLVYYEETAHPGRVLTYRYSSTSVQTTVQKVIVTELSHSYFTSIVNKVNFTGCRVLGVEYRLGNRLINIFFTDEEPTATFKFLNAFNIMETAYLFNTTTIKTDVDRTETVCGNQTQFYDETVKVRHEVETAPLTHDEAMWLNQMLTSRLVLKPVDNYDTAQILISDISSEVSDSDKELVRIKFSWKYADGNEWL